MYFLLHPVGKHRLLVCPLLETLKLISGFRFSQLPFPNINFANNLYLTVLAFSIEHYLHQLFHSELKNDDFINLFIILHLLARILLWSTLPRQSLATSKSSLYGKTEYRLILFYLSVFWIISWYYKNTSWWSITFLDSDFYVHVLVYWIYCICSNSPNFG